jgi:hypothetical protein
MTSMSELLHMYDDRAAFFLRVDFELILVARFHDEVHRFRRTVNEVLLATQQAPPHHISSRRAVFP